MRKISLHSLVIIVGPTTQSKRDLIAAKFNEYEVVSADGIRFELLGDGGRTDLADVIFRELYRRVTLKLELGERVVVDAPSLRSKDRIGLAEIGLKIAAPVYYVVVASDCSNLDESLQYQENLFNVGESEILRGDWVANVIDTRVEDFAVVSKPAADAMLGFIQKLGFRGVMVVGDVHGMSEALMSTIEWSSMRNLFIIFLGDIVDYGPDSIGCVNRIYELVMRGRAVLTIGNHERKIERWLEQSKKGDIRIRISEGNKTTIRAIQSLNPEDRKKFEAKFKALLHSARHHWIVGNTIFAHAGAEPEMFQMYTPRLFNKLESIALFGEIDTTVKNNGGSPPMLYNWVDRIPLDHQAIVGHVIRNTIKPVQVEGELGGRAVFMDTGSGKGGRLTSADLLFEGNTLLIKSFTSH